MEKMMAEKMAKINKLRSRGLSRGFSRVIAFCVFLCLGGAGLSAADISGRGLSASGFSASAMDFIQSFALNPVNDSIQLGVGAALSGSALICDKFVHIKKNEFNPADWKKEDIPELEQIFMRPYSKPLHIVGTGTMGLALAAPAILALAPSNQWLTFGTMYLETLLIANGIKEWTKLLVYRARPYMYFDDFPQEKVEDGDWSCSFPSGHTTFAFAGAAFTTMVFCQCFPNSDWKYVVAGASFGLAALTGAMRMASGNHFLTDVLVGAVIGTAVGFTVPYLHTKSFYGKFEKKSGAASAGLNPAGFTFTYNF